MLTSGISDTASTFSEDLEVKKVHRMRRRVVRSKVKPNQEYTTTDSESEDVKGDFTPPKPPDFLIPQVQRRRAMKRRRSVSLSDDGTISCTVTDTEQSESEGPTSSKSQSRATVASVATMLWDKLEKAYYEHRNEIVSPTGFLSTPLHVVKDLADQFQTKHHAEVFVLTMNQDKVYRVELFVGNIRGIGQSPRRKLSFQLAAADLMDKMAKTSNPKVIAFGVLPGLRVNPSIYRKLARFCRQQHLAEPVYAVVRQRPYEETPIFVLECKIGNLMAYGESDCRFMAKRLAAKAMYEQISGQKVPDDFALIGNECFGLKDLHQKGIHVSISNWKKEWMDGNRIVEDKIDVQEDEPDDRIMEEEEDLEFETLDKIPSAEELKEISRVIANNTKSKRSGV